MTRARPRSAALRLSRGPAVIRMVFAVGVLAAPCSLSRAGAQAQPTAAPPGGSIVGQAVAGDTEAPIRRARIRLSGRPSTPPGTPPDPSKRVLREADTDERGGFAFSGLSAGQYTIWATATGGYAAPARPETITLAADARVSVTLRFVRAGAIAGRVLDEAGLPVARARVQAVPRELAEFGSRNSAPARPGLAITDELGRYRIFDVAEGEYYLLATYQSPPVAPGALKSVGASRTAYRATYHPSSAKVGGATVVAVAPGDERNQVDIALIRTAAAAVSILATDAAGAPPPLAQGSSSTVVFNAWLVSRDDPSVTLPLTARPGGEFSAPDVPVGEYFVAATIYAMNAAGAMQAREGAYVPLSVRGDVVGFPVRTNTGATVRGRIVIESPPAEPGAGRGGPGGAPAGPARAADLAARTLPTTVRVTDLMAYAQPAGDQALLGSLFSTGARATASADGSFEIRGVRGPTRFRTFGAAAFKAARRGGREITGQVIDLRGDERIDDLELVVTTATGDVTGTSTFDAATRENGAWVIAFPEDPAWCYTASPFVAYAALLGPFPPADTPVPPAAAGGAPGPDRASFYLARLLPGRYALVVINRESPAPPLDQATLERLRPRAVTVTVVAGRTVTVDLSLADGTSRGPWSRDADAGAHRETDRLRCR
jgi:hypothetical protein